MLSSNGNIQGQEGGRFGVEEMVLLCIAIKVKMVPWQAQDERLVDT